MTPATLGSITVRLTVTPSDYSQEFAWRSLGLIRAPGRMFELSDNGAAVRIDGLDIR
jgi:hypothetical protein